MRILFERFCKTTVASKPEDNFSFFRRYEGFLLIFKVVHQHFVKFMWSHTLHSGLSLPIYKSAYSKLILLHFNRISIELDFQTRHVDRGCGPLKYPIMLDPLRLDFSSNQQV